MQGDASRGLDVTLKVAVAALAPARVKYTPLIAGVLSSHSILLENAPLITFFTFSPPQALEQPDHFHAGGGAKKKVAGTLQKCEKLRPAISTL